VICGGDIVILLLFCMCYLITEEAVVLADLL